MTNLAPRALGLAASLLLTACSQVGTAPVEDAAQALHAQQYFLARDRAQEALRADPEDVGALAVLTRAQLAMGLGEDALATLARLRAAGGDPPADLDLLEAEAYIQRGDADGALLRLDGENGAEAWRLRALAATIAGDDAAAQAAFLRGREAPGDKLRLYAAQARYLLDRGEIEAAREAASLAQRAGPGRIETLFVTARLAQEDENHELAARAFLGILDISPDDRPALLGAIAELGALDRVEALRPLVARGRKGYPADQEFIFLAARLKALDGDWPAVRELLQKRESATLDHPDSRGLYGMALLELGQAELARAYLAPLYRQDRENAPVARAYASALLATGDKAKAGEIIAPLAASPRALPGDSELAARAAET